MTARITLGRPIEEDELREVYALYLEAYGAADRRGGDYKQRQVSRFVGSCFQDLLAGKQIDWRPFMGSKFFASRLIPSDVYTFQGYNDNADTSAGNHEARTERFEQMVEELFSEFSK